MRCIPCAWAGNYSSLAEATCRMELGARLGRFWLLPAAFATAVLLSRAFLSSAPLSLHTDLAQPLVVATNWHDFGRGLWMLVFGCLLAAAVAYGFILVRVLRDAWQTGLLRIASTCALTLATCLCMPVIFSSDVYAYAAYGWMDAHGISPYAHLPLASNDPLITSAIWQWSNPLPVCVYGPLFVWIAKLCVIGGSWSGPSLQLLLLRMTAAVALILCGPLVYAAMHGFRREQRLLAAAGITLNPVMIWIAAEGHNDTLVLAMVLLGFIAIRKLGYFAGAFMIAAAALVKASSIAAAAVLALYSWHDSRRFMRVVAGAACGVLLTVFIARPFEAGVRTVLIPHGHYAPQFSPQYAVAQLLQSLFGDAAHPLQAGIAILVVAGGILALFGIRRIARGEYDGAAWLALALWIMIPNPYPWYALWILPASFLCIGRPAAWAIVAASITIFVRYLPDVASNASPDVNMAVTLCEISLPLALLLAPGRLRVLNAHPALDPDATP